jgi:uncharacterized protein YkwD
MKKKVFLAVLFLTLALFLLSFGFSQGIEVKAMTATDSSSLGASVNLEAAPSDYEHAVAALINQYREASGLGALAFDETLIGVAQSRSSDMISRAYFSHYTPENTTVFNMLRSAGYSYRYAGENLAQCQPADIGSPEAFLNAWKNSPSHNQNMLRGQYTKIGVGMVQEGNRRVVTTVFSN